MRTKFSLDLKGGELKRTMMLIHGGYASGKTHLMTDFLAYYAAQGSKVRFINIKGEDGQESGMSFNLGEVGETVETYEDLVGALNEVKHENTTALGVDSMKLVSKLAMAKVLGTDTRMPTVGKDGNEWGDVHFAMENITNRMRAAATFVMCLCPSDKSVNQLTTKTLITPDLPGREAAGCVGWFDFVGYLDADVLSPTKVKRTLKFVPNNAFATRQRLPHAIIEDIVIPEGRGGWTTILRVINSVLSDVNTVASQPSSTPTMTKP